MNTSTIPGIVKIQFIYAEHLRPHLMYSSMAGAIPALAAPASNIPFFGTPTLKWESVMENGVAREKATLEFNSKGYVNTVARGGFVVTLASGKQYLIGTREPKYPQITFSETTGTPGGEAAVRTYKITHVAQKSVLPCVL